MDLKAIGDDLSFVEQPGKRYTPSASGMYSLTKVYMGDASDLSTFLTGKTKGNELETGFFVNEVDIAYGFHDANGVQNGTVGDVTVTFHCMGTVAGYTNDTIVRGNPTSLSAVIYKISTEKLYRVDYSTNIREVERTSGSPPNAPTDEAASGVGSAPDPIIYSATPILMKDGSKGDQLKPTDFVEDTDYEVFNLYLGSSFSQIANTTLYRVVNSWTRKIEPIKLS